MNRIQNNNNNNNNKINDKKEKKKTKGRGRERRTEREAWGEFILNFFSLFASFSYLRKLDYRFSLGLKAKLIYAMRATRGHQNLGVSSNSTR